MSDHIVHDMAKEKEILFDHSTNTGYLAIVDAAAYQFFVSPDIDYTGMLEHLGTQVTKQSCVAWGCPEATLKIRIIFAQDNEAFDSITEFTSGMGRWLRTSGRLNFTSHGELYHCATNPEWTLFSFPRSKSPDDFLARELIVPAGIYSVIIFRHFPWFEGSQDAELPDNETHYTIILRHYENETTLGELPPPNLVSWT